MSAGAKRSNIKYQQGLLRSAAVYVIIFLFIHTDCTEEYLKIQPSFTVNHLLMLFFFFSLVKGGVEVNVPVKVRMCERDYSAARGIQISMDWKCFNYRDKKAALTEKEPVCLKMAPAAFEVVSAELFQRWTSMCGTLRGLIFTHGVQNLE